METILSKILFDSTLETGRGASSQLRKQYDHSGACAPSEFLLHHALFITPEKAKAARAQLSGPRLYDSLLSMALPLHEAALKYQTTSPLVVKDKSWVSLKVAFPPVLPLRTKDQGGVGLANPSNICYMNCVIAQLFMVPTFRSGILAASAEPGTILGELARVFAHLAESPCVFADTADLHSTLRDWHGNTLSIHQRRDARDLFALIIKGLSGSSVQSLLWSHFGFEKQANGHTQAAHIVEVPVYGFRSLRDALASNKETGKVEEMETAATDLLHEKDGKAGASSSNFDFASLPSKTMVMHLKRFRWDSDSDSKAKVHQRFSFPDRIDLGGASWRLSGVIIHIDLAASGGHYWSYMRERQGEGNTWVCMDDEKVQHWDFSRLDQDCFGDDNDPAAPSALLLWYDRVSTDEAPKDERSTANGTVEISGKEALCAADSVQENSFWVADVHATAARAQTLGFTPHVALMERLLLLSGDNKEVDVDHSISRSSAAVNWLRILLSHPHAPTRLVATRRTCGLLGGWCLNARLALLRSLLIDSELADTTVHLLEACYFAEEACGASVRDLFCSVAAENSTQGTALATALASFAVDSFTINEDPSEAGVLSPLTIAAREEACAWMVALQSQLPPSLSSQLLSRLTAVFLNQSEGSCGLGTDSVKALGALLGRATLPKDVAPSDDALTTSFPADAACAALLASSDFSIRLALVAGQPERKRLVAPIVDRMVRESRPRSGALIAAALSLLEDEDTEDDRSDAHGRGCLRLLMVVAAVHDSLQEWRVGVVMSDLFRMLLASSQAEDHSGDVALRMRFPLLVALCKGSGLARAWIHKNGSSSECAWVTGWLAAADEDSEECNVALLRGQWDDLVSGRNCFGWTEYGQDDDPRWLIGRHVRLTEVNEGAYSQLAERSGLVVAFDVRSGCHVLRSADHKLMSLDMGRVGWEVVW